MEVLVKAKITIMMYASGGDDFFGKIKEDLLEIKKLGSSDKVNFLCQYGFGESNEGFRCRLEKGEDFPEKVKVDDDEFGEPSSVINFFRWGFENYPADYYGLIFNGHGTGWKPEDILKDKERSNDKFINNISDILKTIDLGIITNKNININAADIILNKKNSTLFRSSSRKLLKDSIIDFKAALLYGFSGRSLDGKELGIIAKKISQLIGKKVDFIGFDCCLMGCIEIASEMTEFVDYLIFSEQTEPSRGWPYSSISTLFLNSYIEQQNPKLEDILYSVPEIYIEECKNLGFLDGLTLSVIRMNKIDSLCNSIKEFSQSLTNCSESDFKKLLLSRILVRPFDYDLIDIKFLLEKFDIEKPSLNIKKSIAPILECLKFNNKTSIFINVKNHGEKVFEAGGLSIYFPDSSVSPYYTDLRFNEKTNWISILNKFNDIRNE